VSHSDYTYLVDSNARIRLAYDFGSTARNLARDIRLMLSEPRPAAPRR
jgi:cytochrome oxidase Cu insertion factor (SCO1/SenC/PrrC family)